MRGRGVYMLPLVILALSLVLSACGDDDPTPTASGSATPTTTAAHTRGGHGLDSDPDLRFIDAMIVHHQSAITMSEMALNSSEREEIRSLASEVIEAQESEIEQMRTWRNAWYPGAAESDLSDLQHMAGMHMTDADMAEMRGADDFDRAFIDMMIPHHESAIEMARELHQTTERPELQQLAEEIMTTQQAEIDQMRAWRAEWYGE